MTFFFILLSFISLSCSVAFKTNSFIGQNSFVFHSKSLLPEFRSTKLFMGARNRAWAKGDLNDKDIFDGDDNVEEKKEKFKLQAETVFFEGPPSPTEIIFPAISILTVIGIVPFIAALSRQFWVKYKFTSRRISLQSGFGGNTQTEIIYPDIEEIRFAFRAFGSVGDMVLFLKDGAKVELRHVPNFDKIYEYVLSQCDEDCKTKSMKMKKSD